MNTKIVYLAITYSFLVACGGGGGGSDSNPDTRSDVQTSIESVGVFLDSPVKGLRYETPTLSGLTNTQGEFRYIEGERVTFFLGKTKLGIAQGASTLTPFDLCDTQALTRESEISAVLKKSAITGYDRAINVATLLQTFDRDANPDNGIDLGTAHTALSNTSINLAVKATDFMNESSLETAKNLVGINTHLTLKQVASHLYQSLNLQVKSDQVNQVNISLDSRQSSTINLEHDGAGNITNQSFDTNNDGIVDNVISFIYDETGNLTGSSNSATESKETLIYDNDNNLVSHLVDNSRQPDIEQTYIFNNNKTLSHLQLDLGDDGEIDSTISYQYDENGHLTSFEVDHDNDGSSDTLASYTYDNNGVITYVEKSDNNPDPNLNISYQYDENGHRISQSINASTEGLPNNTAVFGYDTNGNVTRYEQDNDQDGRADYIEASTYDSNNNRLYYRRDLDADGNWDSITSYTYDIAGNRTSMSEDSNGDGIIDKQWSSNFDTTVIEDGWDLIQEKLATGN